MTVLTTTTHPSTPATALPATKPRSALARFCTPTLADALFVLILLRILQLGSTNLFNDPGTGWHLRTGLEVIASGTVPTSDTFSSTRAGQPWVAAQWLADVIMSLAYAAGGYSLIALLTAALIAGLFRWVYRTQMASGGWPTIAAIVAILAACAASGHFLARPLVATSIGVPLSFWWATQYARGRISSGRLWLLVPLAVVWCNLHPGVLGGVATVGLCSLGMLIEWWRRRHDPAAREIAHRASTLMLVTLAMATATLLNPYGLAWHGWVLRLMNMKALSAYVIEWKPPAWNDAATYAAIGLLGIAAASTAIRRKGLTIAEALIIAFWAYNGFRSGRHLPLMTMIVAIQLGRVLADVRSAWPWLARLGARVPLFSADMRAAERRVPGGLVSLLTVAVLAVLIAQGVTVPAVGLGTAGPSGERYSAGAVAHLRSHPPAGAFLNDMNYGGTLIHNLPGLPVFADDRFGLYGTQFIDDYRNAVLGPENHAAAYLDRHEIQTVLMAAHLPLCDWLRNRDDWAEEYADPAAAIFSRRSPSRESVP